MADIEKVITGLELCTNISQDGCLMLCPYKDEQDETYSGFCEQVLKRDALELLKEQQAEIDRLKAELNQYHKADTFLAVHGWQWKDDGTEHYTEQLKDGEVGMNCVYEKENGKPPCCTHDCNGCMWNESEQDGE